MKSIVLLYLALLLAGAVGWVMNLMAVVHLFVANAPITTMFAGRVIGVVVAPLGGILGYF